MDLRFQKACVLAFYGFLRCNEFTCKTVFDKLLSQLMSVRLNLNANHNDSFFVEETGKPFSRNYFISKLKTILIALGYSDKDYSGQSFRSGAATSASSQGIEDSMIQTLGRWKSDCFKRYIRTSKLDIKSALEKIK
ncbi:Hypothetical predicted protein [Mytilus galloprovincialis]|uniref:Uncharacterized protein n=1 Tax=Mytilus galloprovincialis TaxID=29158 RepID=A0A8B6EGV6_MYTGA|nr:Hypothetical predicted protein [Mytilus galloprovincialis]